MRLQTEQKHFYSHKKNEMRSSLNANFKEANNDENMASGENEDLEHRTKQVEAARMGGSGMPTQKAQIRTALRNQRDLRSFLMERIEQLEARKENKEKDNDNLRERVHQFEAAEKVTRTDIKVEEDNNKNLLMLIEGQISKAADDMK